MTALNPHTSEIPHADPEAFASRFDFPNGTTRLDSQVAGHLFDDKKHSIGMLRTSTGRILKPIVKTHLGDREIAFYEDLQLSQDSTLLSIKNHVPKYYSTTELQICDKRVKFIVLEDITEGMAEPCVMDIKIGKQTWDPFATPEKRATEDAKYVESKRAYGLSITGFQVYCPFSGRLRKFGKDEGKKLDADGVVKALETFLNVRPERPACRQLIVKILSYLWKILLLFRDQRKLRFYASSLLLAYDAKKLRHCLHCEDQNGSLSRNLPVVNHEKLNLLKRSISLSQEQKSQKKERLWSRSLSYEPEVKVERLCRTHSFVNNFDDDILRMKEDYTVLLNELKSSEQEEGEWVRVSMIDFTHVYLAEDQSELDRNYLEGIENLTKLLETFLVS